MKSHVSLGFKLCPVCLTKHSEMVLLNKNLRKTLEGSTFMGYDLCPEHASMSAEYLTMVGVTGNPELGPASFTGEVAHIRWQAAREIFTSIGSRPFVFTEPAVIERLKAMTEPSEVSHH